MVKYNITFAFLFVFCMNFTFAASGYVKIDVNLSPAGSFSAKSKKIKGNAFFKDKKIQATDVEVNTEEFETGIELRDEHFKKRLQSKKYPTAKMTDIEGSNGKGQGTLHLMGKKTKIKFKYKVSKKKNMAKAKFKLNIKEYGIKDVSYMGVGVEDSVSVLVVLPIK